jgi:hypothetical protein
LFVFYSPFLPFTVFSFISKFINCPKSSHIQQSI